MRTSNRYAKFLVAMVFFAIGAAVFAPLAAAQDDSWQLTRADYGFRDQRTDVTDILGDLISRGGVNGRVAVNNQTMGGDPAVGKDKSLRVFATNRKNQEREFDYKEGSFIEANMFSVRHDDWGDRDRSANRNDRGRDDRDRDRDDRGLRIIRGFYGVQGRMVNVTYVLRDLAHNGVLAVNVNNRSMGGDPAIGEDKVLIVIYVSQGQEQAVAVREGNTLSIP
jgi:hypothetical protein